MENWDYCVYCGTKLEFKCEKCREAVLPSWSHCPSCGNNLSIEKSNEEAHDDDWYPFYDTPDPFEEYLKSEGISDSDDDALAYAEVMYQYKQGNY